jgi:hypothetical protein
VRFFFSGEIDTLVYDLYFVTRPLVEKPLNESLGSRDYGPALINIGIIPIIMRPEWLGDRKERRLFQRKQRSADYRLFIDFERFRSGGLDDRVRLLLANVITAIEDLQRKAGRSFDGGALTADILSLFHYERADLWLG